MVAILDTEEIWTLYDIHFDYDMKGNCVTKRPLFEIWEASLIPTGGKLVKSSDELALPFKTELTRYRELRDYVIVIVKLDHQ